MVQKYSIPDTIEDWIRRHVKNVHDVSIMLNVMVLSFPLIWNWLVCNVGNHNRVRVVLAYKIHHFFISLQSVARHMI